MTERPRGSFLLYAVAFGLLAAAGGLLGIAVITFLESLSVLWASTALSGLAIAAAVAAIVVPRR